jgi:hypothetical protein
MPIAVVCPGCKARFSVSDKFAGKKGPCPKCKAPITIPAVAAPEIKIAEPEPYAAGGKGGKGGPISKPIARRETKVAPTTWALIGGSSLLVLVLAFGMRMLPDQRPAIVVGLLVLAAPLAVAGYFFLRDDELEPYSGRPLWIRAGLCGLAYAALWGLYWPLTPFLTGEVWQWLFVGPAFVAAGGGAAYALLDLDFSSGSLHYTFYLIVTLLLRAAMGLPPIWAVTTG